MADARDFLKYLSRSRYSPETIKTYRSILLNFEEWLKLRGKGFDTFTAVDVEEYMRSNYASSSARTFLASIKSYMRFRIGSLSMADPRFQNETQLDHQIRLIRAPRKPSRIRKIALTSDEVRTLLREISKNSRSKDNKIALCGAILTFYFGARPSELAIHLRKARIKWDDREMILVTAKTKSERYLTWHPKITPVLKEWYEAIKTLPYPEEWVTKHLKQYRIGGVRVTSRVARKTFQTNMRNLGVSDFYIDHILGHVSGSAMGDVYTDYSNATFKSKIQEIMCDHHYMIVDKVI